MRSMTVGQILSASVLINLWSGNNGDKDNIGDDGDKKSPIHRRSYYSYDYGAESIGLLQDYGSEGVQRTDAPKSISCYSCELLVINNGVQGYEQCGEPFYPSSSLPTISCTGPCAILYHRFSDTSYRLSRVCMPNCKESKDLLGYVNCCTENLCNGSTASTTFSHYMTQLQLLCITIVAFLYIL